MIKRLEQVCHAKIRRQGRHPRRRRHRVGRHQDGGGLAAGAHGLGKGDPGNGLADADSMNPDRPVRQVVAVVVAAIAFVKAAGILLAGGGTSRQHHRQDRPD